MPESLKGQLRPLKCQLSYLNRADGSCSFSQGHTTVWASCSGPGDVHVSRRENDKMHLDVSYRQPAGEDDYHQFNSLIRSALQTIVNTQLFPRTCLTVTVNCLEDMGSVGAVALTATAMALLDNGIPCRTTFCGVHVARVEGKLVLDPDRRTEEKADAYFIFALQMTETNEAQMIGCHSRGPFVPSEFASALSLAKEGAKQIFAFYKEVMQRKLSVDIFTQS